MQMAKHFAGSDGISVLIREACKEGVPASTLTLACDILRLFVRSHTAALFAASVTRAVNAMFVFKTPKNSDERELDVDVKHAALMLVQLLHAAGDGSDADASLMPEVRWCQQLAACGPPQAWAGVVVLALHSQWRTVMSIDGVALACLSRYSVNPYFARLIDTENALTAAYVLVQQLALAQTVVAHLPACLSAPSTAVQLAACQVITAYHQVAHTKPCLHAASDICAKLVAVNAQMQEVTIAPALQCMGLLSEACADNADAIVRAHGLQQIVHTLEEDCPAQVRCGANICLCCEAAAAASRRVMFCCQMKTCLAPISHHNVLAWQVNILKAHSAARRST